MSGPHASPYLREFETTARLAFSMWNRDPASPAYGSFDRAYWGWKFRDFSEATLQHGVQLAIAYAERVGQTSNLPAWLDGYARYCARLQLRDGSFDQCYPNERTPGVVYDILSALVSVRASPYLKDGETRRLLEDMIARAVGFALRTDEVHGEIANHIAQYAYELFNYGHAFGDRRALKRAQHYLERLLSLYESEEGWFHEYHGPDAGYQTRTLRYLVKIAGFPGVQDLWPVIRGGARFVETVLCPDGSIHPMLGVRSTGLLYPSAIEALAARDSQYRDLADRVRNGWEHRRVPLPSSMDFAGAMWLAEDALDALVAGANSALGAQSGERTAQVGDIYLKKAGIWVRRRPESAVLVSTSLGGVTVAFARDSIGGGWPLVFEDAGYLIREGNDEPPCLSRMTGALENAAVDGDGVRIRTRFMTALHDEMTPWRMVILRLLNLTVLRSQWLGDVFRKLVVSRLMGRRIRRPYVLEREISFTGANTLRIRDRITRVGQGDARARPAVFRCRRLTGNHMASSRYFQSAELEAANLPWVQSVDVGQWLDRTVDLEV